MQEGEKRKSKINNQRSKIKNGEQNNAPFFTFDFCLLIFDF